MPQGFCIWLTGLSGAGKTTIARMLGERLVAAVRTVEILDGDAVRTNLSKGLGFSREDREENIRRVGFVCQLLARNGVAAIAALISPYREARLSVRRRIPNFVEVYLSCPLDVLIQRDVKGLYRGALAGHIPHFTGISDPYEPPVDPEVIVDSSRETPAESVEKICTRLVSLGLLQTTGDRLSAIDAGERRRHPSGPETRRPAPAVLS